jgi:hypothetical protein
MLTLDLRAPFVYSRRGDAAAFPLPEDGEGVLCFALDRVAAAPPEAHSRRLPLRLTGRGVAEGAPEGEPVVIPAGRYRFVQVRARIDGDTLADLAREQQEDALRQGFALEPVLYLRYLHEEEGPVYQLLRPLEPDA